MADAVEVIQDADGLIKVKATMETVTCSWALVCEESATEVRSHPILGGVPVCARHAV